MIIKILQIKDVENTDYAFREYNPAKFSLKDYEVVYCFTTDQYTGEEDSDILETIFYQFNTCFPKDYKGHSLSVSDLVVLESDRTSRLYYCDFFNWTLVDKKEVQHED